MLLRRRHKKDEVKTEQVTKKDKPKKSDKPSQKG